MKEGFVRKQFLQCSKPDMGVAWAKDEKKNIFKN